MSTDYSEDALVEQPAIALFNQLGYETGNCFYERVGSSGSTLGRETTEQVILFAKLRAALLNLNPSLDNNAIDLAIDELARDRNAMSPAQANREVYKLLKDGVRVTFQCTNTSTTATKAKGRASTVDIVERLKDFCDLGPKYCWLFLSHKGRG